MEKDRGFGVECESSLGLRRWYRTCLPMQEMFKRHQFNPWVWKIPWRRAWQPTPVLLPGEPHRQRCLVGYSPRGHKESDMTEAT